MIPVTFEEFKKLAERAESFGTFISGTRVLLTREAVIDWARETEVTAGPNPGFLFGESLNAKVIVLQSNYPTHQLVRRTR